MPDVTSPLVFIPKELKSAMGIKGVNVRHNLITSPTVGQNTGFVRQHDNFQRCAAQVKTEFRNSIACRKSSIPCGSLKTTSPERTGNMPPRECLANGISRTTPDTRKR